MPDIKTVLTQDRLDQATLAMRDLLNAVEEFRFVRKAEQAFAPGSDRTNLHTFPSFVSALLQIRNLTNSTQGREK